MAWSTSADAFSDWLRTETPTAAQANDFPSSSPLHPGQKVTCNGGCLALALFLGLVSRDFAMPMDAVGFVEFPEQVQALLSINMGRFAG